MDKRQAIADKARAMVGCGYIYGATGWICTQTRIDQQAKQYPEYAASIREAGKRFMGMRCYDCAQFVANACREAGVSLPSGATSQWRSGMWADGGTIDTLPKDEPGIIVFREQKDAPGRMAHDGVYLGDGYIAEARGHAYGCVKRKLTDGVWTHWKRLKGLDAGSYTMTATDAVEAIESTLDGNYTAEQKIIIIKNILQKLEG